MTTMPDRRLHPHPNVVFTRLNEEEAVLLHLDTKHYFSLNETGILIWECLQQERSLPETAAALTETYDISKEEALRHVGRFTEALRQDDLVRDAAEAGGG